MAEDRSSCSVRSAAQDTAHLQRARGEALAVLGASRRGDSLRTGIRRLHQSGCLKMRFPRLPSAECEAVLVNTAGGLTGGDRLRLEIEGEAGSASTVTTQACERVYRAAHGRAETSLRLRIGAGAVLNYLPQETILFDGGRFARRLDVECAADSRFLLVESVVLGRSAMGERVRDGALADRWRIRRDGRLVFADELRLDGAIERLARSDAVLGGAGAFATLVWQGADAEAALAVSREGVGPAGGASLVEGLVVARLVAPDGYALRKRLMPLLNRLVHGALPRVWSL